MDIDISYVTLRFYCVPSLDDKNVVVDSSNDAFKSESLLASRTDEEQTYHRSNILYQIFLHQEFVIIRYNSDNVGVISC